MVVELPEHMKGSKLGNQFVPPFVLGIIVAVLFISVPTFSGIYWLCKDVPVSPTLSCPRIIRKKPLTRERFRFFQKQEGNNNNLLSEVPQQDPVACACQIFGTFRRKQTSQVQQPLTCKPEIVEAASSTNQLSDNIQLNLQSKELYKPAFTPEKLKLTSDQKLLISQLAERTKKNASDWEERVSKVRWGGSSGSDWFSPSLAKAQSTDLETLEGGMLLYSYLRIMNWPKDLYAHFPLKRCAKGCDSEVAIRHTLQFREKYKPWMVSPSVKKENSHGCVYYHGFSPSYQEGENGSHALVWIRPGQRIKVDDVFYTRAYVNTLEMAVAASLKRSQGRVGKFNVVVDGNGFSWALTPSLHQLKAFVTILQDHFPDRLGIILLTNLGRVGEFVLKLFFPLITEEVRKKIIILPHEGIDRQHVLEIVVGTENVPLWLGGSDVYQFNADKYYSNENQFSSDQLADHG
jgi:hypothetical protein